MMSPGVSGVVRRAPDGSAAVDYTRAGAAERALRARADLARLAKLVADGIPAEGLTETISGDLGRAIESEEQALARTLKAAQDTAAAELWLTVRAHQGRVAAIGAECLAVVSGVRFREDGVDGGICAVADRLLQDVMKDLRLKLRGLTIPGAEERTSYISGAIGLRYTDSDVWSLPVVLHELGHVLAQSLNTNDAGRTPLNPIRSILRAEGIALHREELWADYFATFAIGAAYPAAMVWYRLDPSESMHDVVFEDGAASTATHPPVDKRVHLMLETLRVLDDEAGKFQHPYRSQTAVIAAAWRGEASEVGERVDVDGDSATRLNDLARQFGEVAHAALAGAKHRSPIGDQLERYLADGSTEPPASTSIRDLVSAAWKLRLAGGDIEDIERRANALATAIIGGP